MITGHNASISFGGKELSIESTDELAASGPIESYGGELTMTIKSLEGSFLDDVLLDSSPLMVKSSDRVIKRRKRKKRRNKKRPNKTSVKNKNRYIAPVVNISAIGEVVNIVRGDDEIEVQFKLKSGIR